MHLLRIITHVLMLTAFFFSCKSDGPLSPEEALTSFKSAYLKSNAAEIEKLLSEKSKEKIRTIVKMFSQMNDAQLKALGEKFGTNAERLKSLSIKDYLTIQLSMSKKTGDDILNEITKHKIIGVDIKDHNAVVRIENGMELSFVKEGHYWKFDMDELSSKN